MRKTLLHTASLLLIAAPAMAQDRVVAARGAGPVAPPLPPIYSLLGSRERLGLTSEQVQALDSIGGWLSTANRALARGAAGADNRRQGEMTADEMAQRGENSARAVRGVESVLTREQRTTACALLPPPPEPGARPRTGDQRAAPGRGAPPPGATPRSMPFRGGQLGGMAVFRWPWCEAAAK